MCGRTARATDAVDYRRCQAGCAKAGDSWKRKFPYHVCEVGLCEACVVCVDLRRKLLLKD